MSPRAGLDTHTLVIAAAEIADEQGLENVTLAALAVKLGVRSPSLYNHINGLQGLHTQMSIYGLQQLYTTLLEAVAGVSGDDAVHALSNAYVHFARQRPGLYETTLRAPEQGNPILESEGQRILSLIIDVLKNYELGEEGEVHAVRGLRSILHGFASLEQRGAFAMPLRTDISFSLLISTFIVGIRCMRNTGSQEMAMEEVNNDL